eukprot:1652597-Rhodomonas_salina.1
MRPALRGLREQRGRVCDPKRHHKRRQRLHVPLLPAPPPMSASAVPCVVVARRVIVFCEYQAWHREVLGRYAGSVSSVPGIAKPVRRGCRMLVPGIVLVLGSA